VVPGGGLSADGSRWIACRKSFFLPVRVLSRLFRGKFLFYLTQAFRKRKLHLNGELQPLANAGAFDALCSQLRKMEWVVYAKRPFGGPEHVLEYLARYTHRVAISNNRMVSLDTGRVGFEWKNYAAGNQTGVMTLDGVEFIRRFLLHVLPSGFVRIRHFGFLANRVRQEKVAHCRLLLSRAPTVAPPAVTVTTCPVCKSGRLRVIEILGRQQVRRSMIVAALLHLRQGHAAARSY
jgi:hypothetical protein